LGEAAFLEDAAGIILDVNSAACALLGYPRESLIGRRGSDLLSPASQQRLEEQRQALQHATHHRFDAQFTSAAGTPVNVVIETAVLYPEHQIQPGAAAFLVIARQVLKRDELERELRLVRHSTATGLTHVTFFISSRHEITRYPPLAAGETSDAWDWAAALLRMPICKPALDKAWAGEETVFEPNWYAPQQSSADPAPVSQQRWLKLSFHPLRLRGTDVTDVCVRVHDETAMRLSCEEAQWAVQRRHLSLLNAALSHELNNLLGVILAQASGMRLAVPTGHLPSPAIGAISDAAQQAASLLRTANEERLPRARVDVNAVVADCAPLIAHLAGGELQVSLETSGEVPQTQGDAEMLKSMLVAVSRHVIDSARGATRLIYRTYAAPSGLADVPPSAGISVGADRAARPMSPDIERGIPELVLAKAILRFHRGQLDGLSTQAQGTLWSVTLPPAEPAPKTQQPKGVMTPASTAAAQPPEHNEAARRILLADDEENFRLFTSWALRQQGYDVIVAKDGQEAFERFQDAPQSFNLVILDAYMPRMGGLEAYLRMQVIRPDLPVIFASGFARGPSMDALIAGCPGPASVLPKPFTAEELVDAVGKAMTPQ
jgi:PAS domain S-box-containing protein